MKNIEKKSYIYMVIAAFVWSGAFIAGKIATPCIPVFSLTFFRFLVAAILMYFVMKSNDRNHPETRYIFRKKHFPKFCFTGIVGMFGYHVLFFTSLKYTSAINASIVGAMNPIITTIIACFAARQSVPLRRIIGIVLSFAGVVLTISNGDLSVLMTLSFSKGDIIMLIAVICWAAYSVFCSKGASDIPPFALTFYSFLFCTIFLIPFVLWEKPWLLTGITGDVIIAVLFMGIFSSVMGYLLQQISIRNIGASRTSIFINLVPIFSMILSVTILHETLMPVKILTAAIIVCGVCICQYDRKS